jgi:hypothetical protein
MPSSLQRVSSRIQRTFADEEFKRIKRAELTDAVNHAVYDLSRVTRIWMQTLTLVPVPAVEDFTVATVATLPPTALPGQTAFVQENQLRYRWRNNQWEPAPYYKVQLDPEVVRVFRTIKVVRNGRTAIEISLQAVLEGLESGLLFDRNNDEPIITAGSQFATLKRPDDGMDLVFTKDFAIGESVEVTVLEEIPEIATTWLGTTEIPDVVATAVEWLATESLAEKLYLQGDEAMGTKIAYIREKVREEVNKADSYLRNINDENSTIKTRPLKWLPEGN